MKNNGHQHPTDREWADASLTVDRLDYKDPQRTIFRLHKTITKFGKTYTQSVWLNIHQLRGVANHELRK